MPKVLLGVPIPFALQRGNFQTTCSEFFGNTLLLGEIPVISNLGMREFRPKVKSDIISASCSVSIHYIRHKGKSDGANIIGGILDGLQGIVFVNDRQITEIHYTESEGIKDQYQVSITELTKI